MYLIKVAKDSIWKFSVGITFYVFSLKVSESEEASNSMFLEKISRGVSPMPLCKTYLIIL